MKLYVYLAAAAALLGLIWYEVGVHKRASRTDAAEAALEASQAAHKADLEKVRDDLKESEEARKLLAKGLQEIADRFNNIKIPPAKTLVKTVEVPGACPRVGVSDDYVRLWNNASIP